MSDSEDETNNFHNEEMENGHVSAPRSFSSESNNYTESEEEEGATQDQPPANQFDTDLPTTHKYLGKLNNVSGYTLYDEGEVVTMLGIHTNTLVFPGFTLPLVLSDQYENSVMQTFLEKHNVFALLCGNENYTKLFPYGVTMEVFETHTKNGSLYLKARGRQRCKLLLDQEVRPLLGGRLKRVTVKVFSESPMMSAICDTQFLTLKSKRSITCEEYGDLIKNYKYRRHHLAQYPLAHWIYDRYEGCYYVKLILDGLSKYYNEEYIPRDPIKLSYWFVQNYQLKHEERLAVLRLNTTLERLRLELKFLNMKRLIICGNCQVPITEQKYVFAMSKDGVQSNYCNPAGHVYETVTVTTAINYIHTGTPSKQFSWFPGYAWSIMHCQNCNSHLGWRFTSKHLKPSSFFGLAKSGFLVKIIPDDESDIDEGVDAITNELT